MLFSDLFYVVRALHKFDFMLVINETPNKLVTSGKKVVQL